MKNKGIPIAAIVGIGLAGGILMLVFSFAVVCVWLRATAVAATAKEERSPSSCRRVERDNKHLLLDHELNSSGSCMVIEKITIIYI